MNATLLLFLQSTYILIFIRLYSTGRGLMFNGLCLTANDGFLKIPGAFTDIDPVECEAAVAQV
jgi:hypothetical protein